MSLNRTLSRLFDEVRREARRNKAFADKLDAIIRAHASNREISLASIEEEAALEEAEPVVEEVAAPAPKVVPAKKPPSRAQPAEPAAPSIADLNPVALYGRDAGASLRETLASPSWPLDGLRALVAEHNLDPAGVAGALDKGALIEHVVAQAKKRIERDKKLFDY